MLFLLLLEEDSRGPYELVYYYPLAPVYDEGALIGHKGDLTEVDLPRRGLSLTALGLDLQLEHHPQGCGVGQTLHLALVGGVLFLVDELRPALGTVHTPSGKEVGLRLVTAGVTLPVAYLVPEILHVYVSVGIHEGEGGPEYVL